MLSSPRMGLALLFAATGATLLAASEPKEEPARGIDGYSYPHRAVNRREFGTGAQSYWLFEPAEPKPESAPVVVFLHGWLAVNPGAYGAWIDHLARSGRIVIFPRYQEDITTRPADFLTNASAAILDALDVLATSPRHIRPDLDRFALIGHSAGGNLAAQLAAVAATSGLPVPRAVVAVMPGEVQPSREPSLSQIPASTLLVVTAADDDVVVGDARAREIFQQATAIPPSRKKYVLYRSDMHGYPWLIAHHFAPTAAFRPFDTGDGFMRSFQMSQAEINAFDHFGFWRLTDLTFLAAFLGRTLDEVTAGGKLFGHLGYWSDGRPVLAPLVGDDLDTIPRVFLGNGLRLIKWSSPSRIRPTPPSTPPHPDEPAVTKARRSESQAETPATTIRR